MSSRNRLGKDAYYVDVNAEENFSWFSSPSFCQSLFLPFPFHAQTKQFQSFNIRLSFIYTNNPTGLFTILETQYQEIGDFCEVEERRATDFRSWRVGRGVSNARIPIDWLTCRAGPRWDNSHVQSSNWICVPGCSTGLANLIWPFHVFWASKSVDQRIQTS